MCSLPTRNAVRKRGTEVGARTVAEAGQGFVRQTCVSPRIGDRCAAQRQRSGIVERPHKNLRGRGEKEKDQ
ncbi:MAG: hypothetical protein DYG98_26865 [Haliscomenobacteraceae bacterium CHB4]|nr:hypothetical protein [Haliscomenobacteraceae bacterium CHB4]